MLEAGKKQKDVAKDLEVGLRTVQRCWVQYNRGGNVDKKKWTGRLKVLARQKWENHYSQVSWKTEEESSKMGFKFLSNGLRESKDTIRWYLRTNLGVKPYHCSKIPLLPLKRFKDWLAFCRSKINWTSEDWKQVVLFVWISFWSVPSPQSQKLCCLDPECSKVQP